VTLLLPNFLYCSLIKARRKETTGRPKSSLEDDIKMDLTEKGWEGVVGIYLTLDRDNQRAVVCMAMNFLGPQNGGYLLSSRGTVTKKCCAL
jgi:hypothetical protein